MANFISSFFYPQILSRIIRAFDSIFLSAVMPHGFDFITVSNLDQQLISYFYDKLKDPILSNKPYILSKNDLLFLCSLLIPYTSHLVRSFLGRSAALDFINLSILYPENCANTSGIPHHDSVGHRLKLFVPLRLPSCMSTPTNYVRDSNTKRWPSYSNPVRADQTRVDTFWSSTDVLKLQAPVNGCYIFDTNGVHWGSYQEIIKPRVNIVFEFSNIKSYFIRGQIGPRMHYSSDLKYLLSEYKLLPFHLRPLSIY